MEIDKVSDESPGFYKEFAHALKDYVVSELGEEGSSDPFDIVREFRSIAGKNAAEKLGSEPEASSDWELEAKLWHLFELLLNFRTSDHKLDSMEVHQYNSGAVFEKHLLHTDSALYQIWIIIVWIQTNMRSPERPTNMPTSKWANTKVSSGIKSCDLDYPLREKTAQLDPRDKEEDSIFFKYIYELLIAGKIEEAFEECRLSDNLTISMVLCGMQIYVNPNIDKQFVGDFESQQGIKKHALWRRTLYSLSQNSELNYYERAVYSYLAGAIPPEEVKKCMGWDSGLLVHLNQILQIEVESYLASEKRVSQDELIFALPSHSTDLQTVLNRLSLAYPHESEHPIRVLMGGIILNTLEPVLNSAVKLLMDMVHGQTAENDLAEKPYLLRIVTHMSILLDIISPGLVSKRDKSKLITAYISIMKLHKFYDVIPIYIGFLDDEEIVDAYSFVLSTLEDSDVRKKQIEVANFLRLPTSNILRKTTERIFADTEEEYTPKDEVSVTYEVSSVDKHLIYGVEWLVQGKLYADAVDSVVALSRRFLINGKIKSLEYFMNRNSLDDLLKNSELEAIYQRNHGDEKDTRKKEIQEYQHLIRELKRFEEWKYTVSKLNSESNVPSLIEKFQQYSRGTFDLIKHFFVELSEHEDHPDKGIFYEIRSLYTPYLIMELHKELVEAAMLLKIPTFIREALKFANLVANETDKLYLLFQSSGKLNEYLRLVAQTATLSTDNCV